MTKGREIKANVGVLKCWSSAPLINARCWLIHWMVDQNHTGSSWLGQKFVHWTGSPGGANKFYTWENAQFGKTRGFWFVGREKKLTWTENDEVSDLQEPQARKNDSTVFNVWKALFWPLRPCNIKKKAISGYRSLEMVWWKIEYLKKKKGEILDNNRQLPSLYPRRSMHAWRYMGNGAIW